MASELKVPTCPKCGSLDAAVRLHQSLRTRNRLATATCLGCRNVWRLPGKLRDELWRQRDAQIRGKAIKDNGQWRLEIGYAREADGRWIADIERLPGVTKYGKTRDAARLAVQALVLQVLADRLEHGEAKRIVEVRFVDKDSKEAAPCGS